MDYKINVRFQSISALVVADRLRHNFRSKKNMQHVDYSITNYQLLERPETNALVKKYTELHKEMYLKKNKRKLRPHRLNSVADSVVTFPADFRKLFDNGSYTVTDLKQHFEKFIELFEASTGGKVLNYFIHLDEKTPHIHLLSTNYSIETGETLKMLKTPEGETFKEYLQDLGGKAFNGLGGQSIRRGDKKKITGNRHISQKEYAYQMRVQGEAIEAVIADEENLSLTDLEELIKLSGRPYSTILTYMKRSFEAQKTAEYIIKQQTRALNKFNKDFPTVKLENFEALLDYIAANKTKLRANNFSPKIGGE